MMPGTQCRCRNAFGQSPFSNDCADIFFSFVERCIIIHISQKLFLFFLSEWSQRVYQEKRNLSYWFQEWRMALDWMARIYLNVCPECKFLWKILLNYIDSCLLQFLLPISSQHHVQGLDKVGSPDFQESCWDYCVLLPAAGEGNTIFSQSISEPGNLTFAGPCVYSENVPKLRILR